MMRLEGIRQSLSLLRRGGRLVSYGEPAGLPELFEYWELCFRPICCRTANHLSFTALPLIFYQISDHTWKTGDTVELLNEGKIKPVIAAKFPILEAAEATPCSKAARWWATLSCLRQN